MGPRETLFHTNGFHGTFIHADAAINAFFRIHNRLAIDHLNCFARASIHAAAASGTNFLIHFSRHRILLSTYPVLLDLFTGAKDYKKNKLDSTDFSYFS
jgi:hypothetical protein